MNVSVIRLQEHIKELVDTGFTQEQAETIVRQQTELISENVATKQDIELLEKKLIIKLGAMMIGGFIFTIGVILSVLPLILK